MDAFAKALVIADNIMQNSDYLKLKQDRYSSFSSGAGLDFENGNLTIEDLRSLAIENGEPKQISGKQELFESIINMYI